MDLPARSPSRPAAAFAAAAAAAVVVVGVAPAEALADLLTPQSDSGSPNAEDIDTLYKITLAVALPIFVGVEGLLIYTLVRFRARRGAPAPPQIRGNTPLEVGWTIGAAAVLAALLAVTFLMLGDIKRPGAAAGTASSGEKPLEIRLNMQQYLFRYDYPGEPPLFSYYELVVPVGRTVELSATSSDVVHAWWVPDVAGKIDGVPGHLSETWFRIRRPGLYYGQCAELCGEGHADMRTRVRAVSPSEFERWTRRQRRDIARAREALSETRRARERRAP